MMAELVQSPAGTPRSHDLTWSIAPLAAENAELRPRLLMTALPRSWHAGTKVFSSHARSVMTLVAGLPPIFAFVKSGYCVFEWLPQMVTFVTASFGTPAFFASAA